MKVAVTGGAGFIGRAVERHLRENGHEPVIIDKASGFDVTDPFLFEGEALIHLAGLLGTDKLFGHEIEAIQANVIGTQHVLDACVAVGAKYVGVTMPTAFWGIYTVTKMCAKGLATAAHRARGLPVSHVRAFNAYGPGQSVHQNKMIPNFARAAWAGEPIPIYGDGTQTVDLIHVDDVGRMLVEALRWGDDRTIDAGTGQPLPVKEIADFVIAVTGSTGGVKHLPMRDGENPTKIAAYGEGWDDIKWRPEFSWERLAETIRWYRP